VVGSKGQFDKRLAMQQKQLVQIKLNLTLDEVNIALNALGKTYTYIEVFGLIEKIKEQVIPQLPVPTPESEKAEQRESGNVI
jgi:hypothetical protein